MASTNLESEGTVFRKKDVEQSITARFEQQVRDHAQRLAVTDQKGGLTYQQLDERANGIAAMLASRIPETNSVVGLLMDEDAWLVASVLGVLKCGAAFLPLDPSFPEDRLCFMAEEAGCHAVLTSHHHEVLAHRLVSPDAAVLCSEEAAPRSEFPMRAICPDTPGFLLYTSGSTGKPKGVVQSHRVVLRNVIKYANALRIVPSDRCSMLFSISFGEAMNNLFSTLLNGASLHLYRVTRDGITALPSWLSEQRISIYHSVPSLFRAWANEILAGHKFPCLRIVNLSAEPAYWSDVAMCRSHVGPDCLFVNSYGTTETKLISQYVVDSSVTIGTGVMPIGLETQDVRIHLVDESGQEVDDGQVGEIVVESRYLTPGYLNRPDLEAERFQPDPNDPLSRRYTTGDLGRMLPGRFFEHLGRKDRQVNVRGFRVELGEVESVLTTHPAVKQSVVVQTKNDSSSDYLVAYFVRARSDVGHDYKPNASLEAELLVYLSERLPRYMLPSLLIELDSLPLTPGGKVDSLALPPPTAPPTQTFVAPGNATEQQLATICGNLLGSESIGIHDDFFRLGGDSLMATKVAARGCETFMVDLLPSHLFNAPTIADLAVLIHSLPSVEGAPRSQLKHVDRSQFDHVPLSFAQQRIWFLEQMEDKPTAYCLPFAWTLRGTLNREALQAAIQEIVNRHETLRTNFRVIDGQPIQIVATAEDFLLPLEDLRPFEPDVQQIQIELRRREEAERPFDMTKGLMLRTSLLQLGDDHHVLLVTTHHIAFDAWSLDVFCRELAILYESHCRDTNPQLPKLTTKYADYAIWQRRELSGPLGKNQLEYWRAQLDGVSTLDFPTDFPRPSKVRYRGARLEFELDEQLLRQLESLGQAEGITLSMTLLAVLQTLLSRYSGQDDIAVATPSGGRNHVDLEEQIGFFVNTLVLRTDLSADPPFRQLLGRVRDVSLAAFDHNDFPFEQLVEQLQPQRDLSRNPLVQVLFQLLEFPHDLAIGELDVQRLPSVSQHVNLDLEMHFRRRSNQLRGVIVYSTDLFHRSTIERMLGHFRSLLSGIVADADQRISQLPMLTPPETRQLVTDWNDTAAEVPDRPVQELFQQQVARTPNAVAVVHGDENWTYQQINERADRLASCLRCAGLKPEACVGLCVSRCADLVIGIFGILKVGCTYVLIDDTEPTLRSNQKLHDAQVSHVIANSRTAKRCNDLDAEIIRVDHMADASSDSTTHDVSLEAAAYVVFTSGSTGAPKGVVVSHRSLANYAWATIQRFSLTPGDRRLQFASLTSDVLGAEIFPYLLSGGSVVFPQRAGVVSIHEFLTLIVDKQITAVGLPSIYWHQWVDELQRGGAFVPDSLRLVMTGMDRVDPERFGVWKNAVGRKVRWFNVYGPSEATIASTMYELGDTEQQTHSSVPIGRPINNARTYIVDRNRNPVPIGVRGELWIGGIGVAKGYLNLPELTEQRFIPDPFGNEPNQRLYRTGDVARYLADGNIEFCGREDDQIKIRGFRVEVDEVEMVIRTHPNVKDVAVCVDIGVDGHKRLISFVVSDGSDNLNAETLHQFLKIRVPNPMLPSKHILIDKLPLTPNGKRDRAALIATQAEDQSHGQLAQAESYVAPRTPVEEILSDIWAQLLSLERVGITDNFFDLGGHSILVIQVVSRIKSDLQIELSARVIFELPTVSELALRVFDELRTNFDESVRQTAENSPGS